MFTSISAGCKYLYSDIDAKHINHIRPSLVDAVYLDILDCDALILHIYYLFSFTCTVRLSRDQLQNWTKSPCLTVKGDLDLHQNYQPASVSFRLSLSSFGIL